MTDDNDSVNVEFDFIPQGNPVWQESVIGLEPEVRIRLNTDAAIENDEVRFIVTVAHSDRVYESDNPQAAALKEALLLVNAVKEACDTYLEGYLEAFE